MVSWRILTIFSFNKYFLSLQVQPRVRASQALDVHRIQLALLHRLRLCACSAYANLRLFHHQRLSFLHILPAVHHQRQRELSAAENVSDFTIKATTNLKKSFILVNSQSVSFRWSWRFRTASWVTSWNRRRRRWNLRKDNNSWPRRESYVVLVWWSNKAKIHLST